MELNYMQHDTYKILLNSFFIKQFLNYKFQNVKNKNFNDLDGDSDDGMTGSKFAELFEHYFPLPVSVISWKTSIFVFFKKHNPIYDSHKTCSIFRVGDESVPFQYQPEQDNQAYHLVLYLLAYWYKDLETVLRVLYASDPDCVEKCSQCNTYHNMDRHWKCLQDTDKILSNKKNNHKVK